MQVRWHEDAVADLVNLRRYIAHENPAAALRVAQKILDRVRLLKEHPLLGKAGRIESTRELVVSGTPYTIIYWPQADVVTILRAFHQARSW